MNKLDCITVGDVTIDWFLQIADENMGIEARDDLISIRSGGKILVDKSSFCTGGNAFNVAVGLSRLGLNTSICAEMGDDSFSQIITKTLLNEKIDTSLIIQSRAETSFAVGLQVKKDRTLFVHHVIREHNFSFSNISAKWIYLSSIGEHWRNAYEKTIKFASENNTMIAFNPGSLQLKDLRFVRDIIAKSSIVFLNEDEACLITENKNNNDMNKIINQILDYGAKSISITSGNKGSYYANKNGDRFSIQPFPCIIVEKTGAGDSYASGFLSAIIKNNSPRDAMRWGSINAASVIEKIGAQEGLMTQKNIEDSLSMHHEFQAKEIKL
ncbi:5-dehydro-2-deoxygluconokinase [Candidatus Levyibacteriota bacterium]|nr:carbohydrate kinase family protein [Candidatus Levybacteria bacterium]GDX62218.1 5-dehydro-2-deoxygluconokinase [Candidatus Levybacteria bacterium]